MTTAERVLDLDAILAPISADAPAGADLRYAPLYDKIRLTRRVAFDKQLGKSATGDAENSGSPDERAAAAREYWLYVGTLVTDALVTQSKDLQLAVWLLEVETYIHGFAGAAKGVELVRALLDRYWDTLYPLPEDDEEPMARRVGALEWTNGRLAEVLKTLPLSSGPRKYSLADLELAQKATGDQARAELAAAGRPTPEQFTQAMSASSAQNLEALAADIERCATELAQLERVTDTQLVARAGAAGSDGRAALVSFGDARKALEECQFQVGRALRAKAPRDLRPGGQTLPAAVPGASDGDGFWDRALQLVTHGQLEGLRLAQDHIDAASSGRERFLRQLQLSELCIQAGMHAFAYPILDELGKIIDSRNLVTWEDADLIRRTWSGLITVCRPLARLRPETAQREAEAQERLHALSNEGQPMAPPEPTPEVET